MNRRPVILSALLLWLSVACATVAQGETTQDDILKSVPDEAIGFLLVNRLQDTSDKIDELAKSLQIPSEPLLAGLRSKLSIEKGFDETRGAAVVVLATEKVEQPAPVFLLPVTDYKGFISQFQPNDAAAEIAEITLAGQVQLVAKKDTYAAIAPRENKKSLEQVLKSKRNVAGSLPKALVGWLARNEASFVVTPRGVKLGAAAALAKIAQTRMQQAAGPAPVPGVPGGGVQIDPTMTAFAEDLLKAMPTEVSHLGLGLWVDPSGAVHLTTRVMFLASGNLAQEAKAAAPPKGDLFEHIPADPYAVAWSSSARLSLSKKLMELSAEAMRSNPVFAKLSEEQTKKLKEAFASTVEGVNLNSGLIGVPEGKGSLYSKSVLVLKVEDSAAYMANSQKAMQVMSDVMKQLDPPPAKYDIQVGKLDDLPMLVFTTDMAAAQPGLPPAAKNMLGPDGKLTTYTVAVDKTTVISTYVSEENARKAVARYRKGPPALSSNPDVAKTAALLPQGVQMVAYISPRGLVGFAKSIMNNMGLPFGPMIPDLPDTPPIGMAARIAQVGLAADLIVPREVFETIGNVIAAMRPPGPN